jgi:hypothetical protein
MDDYERPGEKETVSEIMNILNLKQKDFLCRVYSGEKKHILICSKELCFLTTL